MANSRWSTSSATSRFNSLGIWVIRATRRRGAPLSGSMPASHGIRPRAGAPDAPLCLSKSATSHRRRRGRALPLLRSSRERPASSRYGKAADRRLRHIRDRGAPSVKARNGSASLLLPSSMSASNCSTRLSSILSARGVPPRRRGGPLITFGVGSFRHGEVPGCMPNALPSSLATCRRS